MRVRLVGASLALFLIICQSSAAAEAVPRVWGSKSMTRHVIPHDATNIVAISAGGFHVLALSAEGRVHAWGKNRDGQTNVPSAATNVIAVAGGSDHSLALRDDGRVLGWGRNWDAQASAPPHATNVVQIAAGWAHSLALRADGSVIAWGNNTYGQTEVPAQAAQVRSIAAGYYHNVALLVDGTLATWGADHVIPAEATNVVAIAAGWEHSLALRKDGTVVAWGDNSFGQLNVPRDLTNAVAISAGYHHCVALRADGSLRAWGKSVLGVTNVPSGTQYVLVSAGEDFQTAVWSDGKPVFASQPLTIISSAGGAAIIKPAFQAGWGSSYQWLLNGTRIEGATNRELVLAYMRPEDAGAYTLVVSNQWAQASSAPIKLEVAAPAVITTVGGWGDNNYRQCEGFQATSAPRAISAGGYHALALNQDGTVAAWGKNRDGQTNVPASATNVIAVAAGGNHSLALRADGSAVAWGRNWYGQGSVPNEATNLIGVSAGDQHNLGLKSDGTVIAWGNNQYGQTNVPSGLREVIAVSAGYHHNLALRSDGTVVSWGLEEFVPDSAVNIVAIAAGWWHSLAVRDDGSVLAWGDNRYGQCDIPHTATNVVAVAAGWFQSIALRRDGTVVVWGRGPWGLTNVPAGMKNVAAISAGEGFNMVLVHHGAPEIRSRPVALTSHVGATSTLLADVRGTAPLSMQWYRDGAQIPGATNSWLRIRDVQLTNSGGYTLFATNASGHLASRSVPLNVTPVPSVRPDSHPVLVEPGRNIVLSPVVQGQEPLTLQWLKNDVPLLESAEFQGTRSATLRVTSATKNSSGIYTLVASNAFGILTGAVQRVVVTPIAGWGDNSAGQFDATDDSYDAVSVAAGAYHSLAVLADGRVAAWGDNSSGQSTVPAGLVDVRHVAAGEEHSLALLRDGSIQLWGGDRYGQLRSPVLSRVASIAAGAFHSLALLADGTVQAWGENNRGQTNVPSSATNIIRVAAGREHSLALRMDGSVLAWGHSYIMPTNLTNVVAIAAGDFHSLALKSDGTVVSWGKRGVTSHEVPAAATNILAISAGGDQSVAVRRDGTIVTWGQDYTRLGSFGEGGGPDIRAIAAGGSHTLVLKQTAVSPSTHNLEVAAQDALLLMEDSGQIAAEYQWLFEGTPIPNATNAYFHIPMAQLANGGRYTLVTKSFTGLERRQDFVVQVTGLSPKVHSEYAEKTVPWGTEVCLFARLGGENPIRVMWLQEGNVLRQGTLAPGQSEIMLCLTNVGFASSGVYSIVAENAYGSTTGAVARLVVTPVVSWGNVPPLFDAAYTNVPLYATNVASVAAAPSSSIAVRLDGTVAAWGNDPAMVTAARDITNAVMVRSSHILSSEGKLTPLGKTPVPEFATNLVAFAEGRLGQKVAATATGRVVMWDSQGISITNIPASATNIVDVVASDICLALRENGTILAWGPMGELSVPAEATNIVGVAVGPEEHLALTRDGKIITWSYGPSSTPPPPPGLTNIVQIAGSATSHLALRRDGTLFVWGRDWLTRPYWEVRTNMIEGAIGNYHAVGLLNTDAPRTFTSHSAKKLAQGSSQVLLAPRPGTQAAQFNWYKDGVQMPGATKPFLWLQRFQAQDQGTYHAVVKTPFGDVTGPGTYLGLQGAPLLLHATNNDAGAGAPTISLRVSGALGQGPLVLECSKDLFNWTPILTNAPCIEPVELKTAVSDPAAEFFRVVERVVQGNR